MKIFAKRTKKKADSSAPRTVNKSDPLVEELLKKDSSEWNAKERRMVNRYHKRKTAEPNEKADLVSTSETEKTEDANEEIEEPKEDTKQEETDDSSSEDADKEIEEPKEDTKPEEKDDSDDDSTSSSEDEDEIVKEAEKDDGGDGDSSSDDSENSSKVKVQQSTIEKEENTDIPDADKSTEEDGKVGKDHEIWSVLDKLNSKQKRTLSRKLERLGKSVLEEIEQEANKILDETIPVVADLKRDNIEASSDTIEPKKKKQKKGADWSSLPTEERLRREDQRKKQEEAAERKARGESIKPGHKRPLNSERRRANRRKPKWAPKSPSGAPDIKSYKQEHHSSGFLVRKNPRQLEEMRNNY
jgi:hypothetical protein